MIFFLHGGAGAHPDLFQGHPLKPLIREGVNRDTLKQVQGDRGWLFQLITTALSTPLY